MNISYLFLPDKIDAILNKFTALKENITSPYEEGIESEAPDSDRGSLQGCIC